MSMIREAIGFGCRWLQSRVNARLSQGSLSAIQCAELRNQSQASASATTKVYIRSTSIRARQLTTIDNFDWGNLATTTKQCSQTA